ncbi:hypothetical protein NMG60_11013740 [Bertholletia excelsa]
MKLSLSTLSAPATSFSLRTIIGSSFPGDGYQITTLTIIDDINPLFQTLDSQQVTDSVGEIRCFLSRVMDRMQEIDILQAVTSSPTQFFGPTYV